MNQSDLADFATRYALAWSGQNPEDLALCYAEDGSLTVNAGTPSVGRVAIAAKAKEFMIAFPDMMSGRISMNVVMRVAARKPSISCYPAQELGDAEAPTSPLTAILASGSLCRTRA